MKMICKIAIAVAAGFLVACNGQTKKDEAEAANVGTKPVVTNPRPDRSPPPPQPQDGSMIVTPGGTEAIATPKVSEKQKNDALEAAQREIVRRKQDAGEADDAVSKALKNIKEDDLDRAFSELKKAVDKYPKTRE